MKKNGIIGGVLWLIIGIFVVKEGLWAYLIPPWEAPDELGHYSYVETLFYEQKLPELGTTLFSRRVELVGPLLSQEQQEENTFLKGLVIEGAMGNVDTIAYVPGKTLNWIAQHPPLYYAGLLPIYSQLPRQNVELSIFLLRFTSIILGAITLWFYAKTLEKLLPARPLLNVTIISAIAFLPMFSASFALLNNDNLVAMLSAILLYKLVDKPTDYAKGYTGAYSWFWTVGLVCGLLALTKFTALPVVFVAFMKLLFDLITAKNNPERKKIAIGVLIVILCIGAIAGWWYARNYTIFQTPFPELKNAVALHPEIIEQDPYLAEIFPEAGMAAIVSLESMDAYPAFSFGSFLFKQGFLLQYGKNIWTAFGTLFSRAQSFGIAIFCVLALFGYLKKLLKKPREKSFSAINFFKSGQGIFFILALILFAAITWKVYQISAVRGFLGAMHGRYFLPALLPLFYFLWRGWDYLLPEKYKKTVFAFLIMLFVVSDFATIFYVIIPTFY